MRNIPDEDKEEVAEMLKEALEDGAKMQELDAEHNLRQYSKSANTIDKFSQDLWNYKAFPKDHRKRIRTTNGLERINKELKKRYVFSSPT